MINNKLDFQLLILYILSAFKLYWNSFICLLIKYIDDKYLYFVNKYIDDVFSQNSTDSDSDEENIFDIIESKDHDYIKTVFNKYFSNDNIKINIMNKINNNRIFFNNLDQKNNSNIFIIECCLFNLNIKHNNLYSIKDIYLFTNKLILFFNIYYNINSKYLLKLFNNYQYIYILYKKNNMDTYQIKCIDLYNNIDIFKNKKLYFNNIIL